MNRGVLAAVSLAACADGVGVEQAEISGGTADLEDVAVVAIVDDQSGGTCTGALIAPNLVLTAQHCVAAIVGVPTCTDGGTFAPPRAADGFFVTTRAMLSFDPADYHPVAEIAIPPGGPDFCGRDIALLVLGANVPASEATPLAPRVDTPAAVAELYAAVGYGVTSSGGNDGGERRRRDGLAVACVGDCPSAAPAEWRGEAGICEGDSGGPALDGNGDVIGVVSRGAFGCIDPIYTSVLAHATWLRNEGARAATVGGYPPPSWVTGEPLHTDAGPPPDDANAPDARPAPEPADDGCGCTVGRAPAQVFSPALALLALAAHALGRPRKPRPRR